MANDLAAVDLTDLDLWKDGPPHALFARMRTEEPVRWNPSADGYGFWSLTRGADITYVSKNPGLFSSARGGIFLRPDALGPLEFTRNFPIFKDPPEHAVFREIVHRAFRARTMVLLEAVIKEVARANLDRVVASGSCDLVRDIAEPIPLQVIGRMLGAGPEDMAELLAWTTDIERGMAYGQDVTPTFKQMGERLLELVDSQLVRGVDSLAKSLAEAEFEGRRLTEAEIAVYFGELLYAGNGPTRAAISNGVLALLEHPEQLAVLRADPTLLRCTRSSLPRSALAEILRWTTPVNYFARTATENTSIGGVDVKADDRLVMWYVSASRDPEVMPGAETFDVERRVDSISHFAFGGGGPHQCQGSFLAIWMLSLSLIEIVKRMPDLAVSGEIVRTRTAFTNQVESLPVTFTPAA